MIKAGRILVLLAGLGIILGIAVRASAKDSGSRGVIQFQGVGGTIQIWSQDVALLQERIGVISEEAFDPAYYSTYSVAATQQGSESLGSP